MACHVIIQFLLHTNFVILVYLEIFFFNSICFYEYLPFPSTIIASHSHGFYVTFLIICFIIFFFFEASSRPHCYLPKNIKALSRYFFIWEHTLLQGPVFGNAFDIWMKPKIDHIVICPKRIKVLKIFFFIWQHTLLLEPIFDDKYLMRLICNVWYTNKNQRS